MPGTSRQNPSRVTPWRGALLIGAGVATLRWLTLDFDNDYFMHLSWASQIRLGELPVRDFVEPGFALQTLLSYLLLKLGGFQLAAEGLLACAFIGAGAACTYATCRYLGLSRTVSVVASVTAALTYPRFYAYPKAFAYPAALLAIAVHVERPRLRTLAVLASVTAIAFLLRHDHGVYIVLPAATAVWLADGREWQRRSRTVAAYLGLTLLFTLPWLAWIAMSGQSSQYVRTLAGDGAGAVMRFNAPDLALQFDRSAPLVALRPVRYPEVGIRWSQNSSDADRHERETRYRLQPNTQGTYWLRDFTATNVNALLRDPFVDDTRGIDRRTGRVPSGAVPWAAHRIEWWLPLFRVQILPGLVNEANALPWLTAATFALPWALLIVEAVRVVRRGREAVGVATITIVATALMAIIGYQGLVRGSPESRIGDVASPAAIIAAYLATAAWRMPGSLRRVLTRAVICVLAIATAASALTQGRVIARLEAAGVDGPTNFVRRATDVFTLYNQHPLDSFAPPGATGLPRLARWLNECTSPGQRVAVVGFEPEINVWAERGFAGGLSYFYLRWMSDPRDQRVAIERWRTQDVPFVLVMTTEAKAFQDDYRLVSAWVADRYRPVQTSTFGGNKEVTVLLDRRASVHSTHVQTGLPCLASPPPVDQPVSRR